MCPGNITGLRQEKRECVPNQIISGVLFQLLHYPPECCKFAVFGSARTNQTKGEDVWILTGPNKADLKNRMKSKAQAAVYTRLHFKYSRVWISGTSVTTCTKKRKCLVKTFSNTCMITVYATLVVVRVLSLRLPDYLVRYSVFLTIWCVQLPFQVILN